MKEILMQRSREDSKGKKLDAAKLPLMGGGEEGGCLPFLDS
jgi:hypothetical protein